MDPGVLPLTHALCMQCACSSGVRGLGARDAVPKPAWQPPAIQCQLVACARAASASRAPVLRRLLPQWQLHPSRWRSSSQDVIL